MFGTTVQMLEWGVGGLCSYDGYKYYYSLTAKKETNNIIIQKPSHHKNLCIYMIVCSTETVQLQC